LKDRKGTPILTQLRQMPTAESADVTRLLSAWGRGDRSALDELLPTVYAELRRLAARHLRHERPDHTLQTTALVHEAYLRLVAQRRRTVENRAHFFAMAAQMMRRILVDQARRRRAGKRGSGQELLPLDGGVAMPGAPDVIALDYALVRLATLDPRQSRIVELRFFGGLSLNQTSKVVGVSPATVKREWQAARAWLYREIAGGHRHAS
jgi:RNA polymerase sigma factor (TIGR02999 family)